MRSVLNVIPGLGCAAMMVGMMWMMGRGKRQVGAPSDHESQAAAPGAQLADLRAEVERLRADLGTQAAEQKGYVT